MSDMLSVIRGGCWGSPADFCRSAYRIRSYPSLRYDGRGFRVVKETKPKYRVLRGGGWFSNSYFLSSSLRFGIDPSFGFNNFGFRVVKGETNE